MPAYTFYACDAEAACLASHRRPFASDAAARRYASGLLTSDARLDYVGVWQETRHICDWDRRGSRLEGARTPTNEEEWTDMVARLAH